MVLFHIDKANPDPRNKKKFTVPDASLFVFCSRPCAEKSKSN